MVGRGTRPLPGVDRHDTAEARRAAIAASAKPCVTVLDFVGNSGRHKLVTTADILGGKVSEEAREKAKKKIEEKGESADIREELEAAELEALRDETYAEVNGWIEDFQEYFPGATGLHDVFRGIEALENQRDDLLAELAALMVQK
jgi:type I site-specific restriction endonuclease